MSDSDQVPYAGRKPADTPGHWLLARMGKRVLRPGGLDLTRRLLDQAGLAGADVVEFAPGLGRTATEIFRHHPGSYVGVEKDEDAARLTEQVVSARGQVIRTDAANTGLAAACADVVIGEAMLTMQTDTSKRAIVAEAARLLKPGGRYAIHELGLQPDDIDSGLKSELKRDLARVIKVNARPLTIAEWSELLAKEGLVVQWADSAPMALLQVRRNIADEGLRGTARIIGNVLKDADARARVRAMRALFKAHRRSLRGVALVAERAPQA